MLNLSRWRALRSYQQPFRTASAVSISRAASCATRRAASCLVTAPQRDVHVQAPVVELDGDEMARIIWKKIKEQLILPWVTFADLQYYDLSLSSRNETDDRITVDAAHATVAAGAAFKCATITPDADRMTGTLKTCNMRVQVARCCPLDPSSAIWNVGETGAPGSGAGNLSKLALSCTCCVSFAYGWCVEFNLKRMFTSPNGTLRNIIDGTIFREPIVIPSVPRHVSGWQHPIVVARHAFGDQYNCVNMAVPGGAKVALTVTTESGTSSIPLHDFDGDGVALAMFNTHAVRVLVVMRYFYPMMGSL